MHHSRHIHAERKPKLLSCARSLGEAACASGRSVEGVASPHRFRSAISCQSLWFAALREIFAALRSSHRDLSIGTLFAPQVFQVTSLHTAHQWLEAPDLGYDADAEQVLWFPLPVSGCEIGAREKAKGLLSICIHSALRTGGLHTVRDMHMALESNGSDG